MSSLDMVSVLGIAASLRWCPAHSEEGSRVYKIDGFN